MIWPAIAPMFEKQMAFNAAVVEHLNRNVAAHRDAHAAIERALPALRDSFDALVRFESLLVQFLQTITPLADTHYREIDDAIAQLRTVTDVAQRTAMIAKREVDRARATDARCTGCTRCTRCTRCTSAPVHPIAPRPTSASKIAFAARKPRFARGSPTTCRTSPVSRTCSMSVAAAASFSTLLRERGHQREGTRPESGDDRGLPHARSRRDGRRCAHVSARACRMNRLAA